jgi:hypothetical protein
MYVVEMECQAFVHFQVSADAPALFPAGLTQVIAAGRNYGQSTKNHVAVSAAFVPSRFTQPVVEPQRRRYEVRLILLRRSTFDAHDLLKRYDISIYLSQDIHYARRAHTTVKTSALVDVVRYHPELFHLIHCFATPSSSGTHKCLHPSS